MFSRVFDWFRRRRAWTEDHKQAWLGMTEAGVDGVTELQKMLSTYLQLTYPELEFAKVDGSEAYFVSTIPNSKIKVYLFPDGIQIVNRAHLLRAEEWDYRTPGDMIDAMDKVLRSYRHAT